MTVDLKPGESQESLLRRFRKRVSESGVLSQVRKRRRYVSKSEERRRAKARRSEGPGAGNARESNEDNCQS
ncbi:MAG: 30S ribosomal protein S21 [Anaerolineales bacterium]|nr:MAG: 30S ribosomal protein S21 [Anaerolineales bacterium]